SEALGRDEPPRRKTRGRARPQDRADVGRHRGTLTAIFSRRLLLAYDRALMNGRTIVTAILSVAASLGVRAQSPPSHSAEHHEFVINNFPTESGVTLPKARIVYGTYGRLNAARDNAVLLPSHYMANHHGYDWLIGADRALDSGKLFLIATELF